MHRTVTTFFKQPVEFSYKLSSKKTSGCKPDASYSYNFFQAACRIQLQTEFKENIRLQTGCILHSILQCILQYILLQNNAAKQRGKMSFGIEQLKLLLHNHHLLIAVGCFAKLLLVFGNHLFEAAKF
jgi:hypothetical protein